MLPARCCACCAENMSFALVEDPGNDIVEVALNQRGSEMKSSLGLCRIIMNFRDGCCVNERKESGWRDGRNQRASVRLAGFSISHRGLRSASFGESAFIPSLQLAALHRHNIRAGHHNGLSIGRDFVDDYLHDIHETTLLFSRH